MKDESETLERLDAIEEKIERAQRLKREYLAVMARAIAMIEHAKNVNDEAKGLSEEAAAMIEETDITVTNLTDARIRERVAKIGRLMLMYSLENIRSGQEQSIAIDALSKRNGIMPPTDSGGGLS